LGETRGRFDRSVQRLELEENARPAIITLLRLADAFDCDVSTLIEEP